MSKAGYRFRKFISSPVRNVLGPATSKNTYHIDRNDHLPSYRPLIFACTHQCKDDIALALASANRHTYLLFASLPDFYGTLDGLALWLNGVILVDRKDPASSEEGETLFTCVECGETKTASIAKNPTNHASYGTVVKNAADATCEADGYTGDVCCKGCGAVLTKGETIPATGHADTDGDGACDDCGASLLQSNCSCGKNHTGPLSGLVIFFHKIIYFFKNLFK